MTVSRLRSCKATTKAVVDKLGEYGYAFATVNAQPQIDQEHHTVDLTLQVDPSRRVYVRRINIVGNTRTRDEVVRREMRQLESSWFDSSRLALSKDRINRLGYFTDVDVTTVPVEGTADQVDVDVKVTEKPTGSVTLGLGLRFGRRSDHFGGRVAGQRVRFGHEPRGEREYRHDVPYA